MARMIPPLISRKDSPPGEIEIFDLLRTDENTKDWIVLHSLDIPQHIRQIEGEADFLVIVPSGAVVCLEVKSHLSASRDKTGMWKLGDDSPTHRSPFKQSSEAMHSVRGQFKKIGSLKAVPFVSLVVFPRCVFDVSSPEWEKWQVIDEPLIRILGIGNAVSRAIKAARRKYETGPNCGWFVESEKQPNIEQCELILQKLRPAFERHRSPKQRLESQQIEMKRYTEEQYSALDLLIANKRIVFSGAAGTGKTYLAVESARRSVLAGKKVLFVCFNRLLSEWLKREIPTVDGKIFTSSLHAFMLQVADVGVGNRSNSDFWTKDLPRLGTEKLLSGSEYFEYFDQIVVDEAQDICSDINLDFLDLCLKDNFKSGSFTFFGDFERQRIYSNDDNFKLLEQRSSFVNAELSVNCRNRPRVGDLAGVVSGFGHPYKKYLRPDDGIEVGIYPYSSKEEQINNVVRQIEICRSEGYELDQIVLLSSVNNQSVSRILPKPAVDWISEASAFSNGKIRSSTVQAFKGLESSVVILTDFNDLKDLHERQLLYVGASRSTEKLIINLHSSTQSEIVKYVLGGNNVKR